jgi:predicted DCC family thiol-disulfide oxidoreductase YuxK
MADNPQKIKQDSLIVYFDGACPKCLRDRKLYETLAGSSAADVSWFDITGQENRLRELGIDPHKALSELHVSDAQGRIFAELDAYRVLLKKIWWLKPLAWLIGLPGIRALLAKLYHRQVKRRLKKRGIQVE